MNYFENKDSNEIETIIKTIEKNLGENDFECAFLLFLLYVARLSEVDRDGFIMHFHKYFRKKYF
jgi:hypothetical protein